MAVAGFRAGFAWSTADRPAKEAHVNRSIPLLAALLVVSAPMHGAVRAQANCRHEGGICGGPLGNLHQDLRGALL